MKDMTMVEDTAKDMTMVEDTLTEKKAAELFETWCYTPMGDLLAHNTPDWKRIRNLMQQAFIAGWAFSEAETSGNIVPIIDVIGTGRETFGSLVGALENATAYAEARRANIPVCDIVGCSPAQ